MAENPIRKEDIIDIEGLREELKGLITDLTRLAELMKGDLKNSAAQFKEETAKIDVTTKEGRQQMKDRLKDITDLTKQYNSLNKAVDSLNKDLKNVPQVGSYNDLNNKLKELRAQFKATADEGMRNNLIPRIKELDTQLKKLDASIGNHQRNVGNYKSALDGLGKKILEVGKSFIGFGSGAALAGGALENLKKAFYETEVGATALKARTEGFKTFFQNFALNIKDIWNPVKFGRETLGAALLAAEAARKLQAILLQDREDKKTIVDLETRITIARYKSTDAMSSQEEQLKNLNEAMRLEDELIRFRTDDINEELTAYNELLKYRKNDIVLLERVADLESQLTAIKGDRNLRLMSRASQIEKSRREEALKDNKEIAAEEVDFSRKMSNELVDIKLKQIEKTQEAEEANAEFEKELSREVRDEKISNFVTEADKYLEVAASINTGFIDLLEKRKQKELSAVGDNAAKREAIEREYAKKEQALAISDAIIKGAQAIVRQFSDLPFYAALITSALTAATTATQIGIISSQKFAEGGYTGDGTARDETGERVAGVVHEKEYVIPKEPTRKYRALLEAIHEDNPMAIAEELRNRQFHTVWGGVQPQLIQAQKQDPYTKMMYELLKNSVTTYTDSNGDTVLRFADGSTRVIKK